MLWVWLCSFEHEPRQRYAFQAATQFQGLPRAVPCTQQFLSVSYAISHVQSQRSQLAAWIVSEERKANSEQRPWLHPFVIWTAAALGGDPGDDLVRVHDVAGLAMHAVRSVQMDLQSAGRVRGFDHLVNVGRAKVLAGVAVLFHAALVADVGVVDHEVRRLVFFMLRAGVIHVGQLVEGELAVALGGADNARLRSAVRWKPLQLFHACLLY